MRSHSLRSGGPLVAALLAGFVFVCFRAGDAQTRFAFTKGQSVTPAYEGWWPNEDGSFTLFFGYFNTNWQEEFDVPVGPGNAIEPGGPDQGQPTHFYPRRNPFLFTVRVPKEFETTTKELVWTLTTNGKTERTYASLKGDYRVDPQVIQMEVGGDRGSQRDELRTNKAPELRVEGSKQRAVKVGETMTLVAVANDPDNLPARKDQGEEASRARGRSSPATAKPPEPVDPLKELFTPPPNPATPQSPPGLRLSWLVYRGKASSVTFSPEQMKTWEDTRPFANSPWSPGTLIPQPPPDGRWVVHATFQEPGSYILRAVASDSALFTYENVAVTVTR
jgi:autonomous glycyl radical cofactor GrcA